MFKLKNDILSRALILTVVFTICYALLVSASSQINDAPMNTKTTSGPPSIMFVLDDSGSMDASIMTQETNGVFYDGSADRWNVYGYIGDNEYGSSDSIPSDRRNRLKSQCAAYNKIYYNPFVKYEPWPSSTTYTLSNADPLNPRSDPIYSTWTLNMSDTYCTSSYCQTTVSNAHYYTWVDSDSDGELDNGEDIYLVNFVWSGGVVSRNYYKITNSDNDYKVESGELTSVTDLPTAIKDKMAYTTGTANDADELQNFANWYSYYRRRELTLKAAVSNIIDSLNGVKVGFYGINSTSVSTYKNYQVRTECLPVNLNVSGTITDKTGDLLDMLYKDDSYSSTPLRPSLNEAGKYFSGTSSLGSTPYVAEADGGACQMAFTVLITDGFWNGSSPGVGNQDKNTSNPYDGGVYADDYSDTLADVAMKYYKNDLNSTLSNSVPLSSCDQNPMQHMVTYTVAFGLKGTLDPSAYSADPCFLTTTGPTWPQPSSENIRNIDDLWHAAVNGRGEYYSASNPEELVDSLKAIFESIDSRTASGASVSVNGEELSTNLALFQGSYNPDTWTGDVIAYPIDATTGEVKRDESDILWKAAAELESLTSPWTSRKIVTYNPDTPDGIPFQYSGLTTTQKAYLNNNSDIVDFIRGKAISGFRVREQLLGDIIHASPVYYKDSSSNETLYTGGNDGMLHAFNASDGSERFAYIPNLVIENLKELKETTYSHKFFVDMTPTIRSMPGKTILVGGLGKGGKGYYSMDVTSVDETDETTVADAVLWEYPKYPTVTDDDLGYTFSKAFVNPTNSSDASYEWLIMFGNGYESVNGHAVFYILDLNGNVVRKIDTGVGSSADPNGLSTPSLVDVNADQKVDYAYAGDLKGNLWKFDLTDSDYTKWNIAYKDSASTPQPLFQAKDDSGNTQPITVKPDVIRHCNYNPNDEKEYPGYIVVFATGKFLGGTDSPPTNDKTDTNIQTMYGIWDYGDDSDDDEYLGSFERSASNKLSNQAANITLLQQTEEYWGLPANSTSNIRIISDYTPKWSTIADTDSGENNDIGSTDTTKTWHAGWYFDLIHTAGSGTAEGERVIIDPIIRQGVAIIISFTPNNQPCEGGGTSIMHEIVACTGSRTATSYFDINADGKIDSDDLVNYTGAATPTDSDYAAPSGKEYSGILYPPKIIQIENSSIELKLMSSSDGASIVTVTEQAEKRGFSYWQEL